MPTFLMDRYPITQAQYEAVMATNLQPDSRFYLPGLPDGFPTLPLWARVDLYRWIDSQGGNIPLG